MTVDFQDGDRKTLLLFFYKNTFYGGTLQMIPFFIRKEQGGF